MPIKRKKNKTQEQREKELGYCDLAQTYCSLAEDRYKEGRADAYIQCMKIISEVVWGDSEIIEKMMEEQLKEKTECKQQQM